MIFTLKLDGNLRTCSQAVLLNQPDHVMDVPTGMRKLEILQLIESSKEAVVTCISGRIPFPKIAAIMEMEVKALNSFAEFEDSKE